MIARSLPIFSENGDTRRVQVVGVGPSKLAVFDLCSERRFDLTSPFFGKGLPSRGEAGEIK